MRFDFKLLDFVECEKEFDKLAVCGSDKDLTWSELKNEVDSFKKNFKNIIFQKGIQFLFMDIRK